MIDKLFKMHTFNIDKKWLDLIKSGEKKSKKRDVDVFDSNLSISNTNTQFPWYFLLHLKDLSM